MKRGLLHVLFSCICISGLTIPSIAFAGNYQVVSCGEAPSGANNAWVKFPASAVTGLTTQSTCPPSTSASGERQKETGIATFDTLGGGTAAGDGAVTGWRLSVPAGTAISAVRYRRYNGKFSSREHHMFLRTASGQILDGDCDYDIFVTDECRVGVAGGSDPTATFEKQGLSTSSLETGIFCKAKAPATVCGSGVALHNAWAVMYGSRVTITDPVVPALGVVSGSLVDGSSRWRFGVDEVRFGVADNVGVRETLVRVDGRAVARVERLCDYTLVVPCTDEPGVVHRVDWRSVGVGDGAHRVEVVGVDAAGNEVVGAPVGVNVDLDSPAAPVGLSTPAPVQDGDVFSVGWENPVDAGSPVVRADWKACKVDDAAQCVTGVSEGLGVRAASVRVPGRGRWRVSVWLTDAVGHSDVARAAQLVVENRDVRDPGNGGGDEPKVKPLVQSSLLVPSVKRLVTGRLVALSGRISPVRISGSVVVEVFYRSKRAFRRVVVPLRSGGWRVSVRVPVRVWRVKGLRGLRVRVTYGGGESAVERYSAASVEKTIGGVKRTGRLFPTKVAPFHFSYRSSSFLLSTVAYQQQRYKRLLTYENH